jgi:hypothetical protein
LVEKKYFEIMSKRKVLLDLGEERKEERQVEQRDSVAFLLGAGFSIPMGYPTGSAVNSGILDFDNQKVSFSPSGELASTKDGIKTDSGYTNYYDREFSLCKKLIAAYNDKVDEFDYEKFMDVLRSKNLCTEYSTIFDKYVDDYATPIGLAGNLPDIYSQMVAHLIKDTDDKAWYEGMPTHIGPYLNGPRASYNSFLQYISLLKEKYLVNIHTLNHDLFLESFNRSGYFKGDLSDGFDDYGSRYYGRLYVEGRDAYRCRLERYTGRYYGAPIRLYKLHGSLNYVMMHRESGFGLIDDCEVKIRYGMGLTDLERERSKKNGYDTDFLSYHADFLTGATTKPDYYKRSRFYKKLFRKFKNNLIHANSLMVIGYGGKDEGINDYLLSYFDYQNKPCYFIDPGISHNTQLMALADKMHATKIEKSISDFDARIIKW